MKGLTGKHLVVICFLAWTVKADYHIGFTPRQFSNPTNTLYNGTCCNPSCTDCVTTTLRFCFRATGHSQSDTGSPCSIFQLNRNTPSSLPVFGTDVPPIKKNYTGSFQLYVRVSHHPDAMFNPDFDPPFTDPLIDNIFLEAALPAASFEDRNTIISTQFDNTGEFGRVSMQIRINVHCARGYNGSDCSTFCEDVEGELMCEQVVYEPPTMSTPTETTLALTTQVVESDQTVAIAVGTAIGGTVVLLLLVGVVISFVFFVVKVWRKDPYKYGSNYGYSQDLQTESKTSTRSTSQKQAANEHQDDKDLYAIVSKTGHNEIQDLKNKGLTYAELDMTKNGGDLTQLGERLHVNEDTNLVTYTTVTTSVT